MLECGRQSSNDLSGALRLLRASVKTAKLCQEHLVLPLAQKILERAAMYQEELSKAPLSSSNDEVIAFASLRVDYYTARISLVSSLVVPGYSLIMYRQESKRIFNWQST